MKDQEKGYLYFDIPKQERDSAIAFLLDALLKSRMSCHFPSNSTGDEFFDEDVNIYLAHLLFAASLPDYQSAIKRYLSTNIQDMNELIEKNDDRIVRYFIYKVNADHLMVHLGIFQNMGIERHFFDKTEEQYSNMAKAYYEQAAEHSQRIYRRKTAIGSVLGKLSLSFDRYKLVLHSVRKDFFHFMNYFNDQNFGKFCEDINRYIHEELKSRAIDQFLDAYAEWMQTKDLNLRRRLEQLAKNIREIDPQFSLDFKIDQEKRAC